MEQNKEGVVDAVITLLEHIGEDVLQIALAKLIAKKKGVQVETEGCNGAPMPTSPPAGHTLGSWVCSSGKWQWQDELG